jgi:hypothetical protein
MYRITEKDRTDLIKGFRAGIHLLDVEGGVETSLFRSHKIEELAEFISINHEAIGEEVVNRYRVNQNAHNFGEEIEINLDPRSEKELVNCLSDLIYSENIGEVIDTDEY